MVPFLLHHDDYQSFCSDYISVAHLSLSLIAFECLAELLMSRRLRSNVPVTRQQRKPEIPESPSFLSKFLIVPTAFSASPLLCG